MRFTEEFPLSAEGESLLGQRLNQVVVNPSFFLNAWMTIA